MSPHPVDIGSIRTASLNNIRCVVTTRWGRGYSKKVIRQVESFYIDSSLDNDSDTWHLEIGDPTGEFLAMMERNNEVRVEILSTDPKGPGHILTGIADDLTYDQDGVYQITGRDYAALALDSTAPNKVWKKVKPKYIIANQARELGFPGVSLNEDPGVKMVRKVVKTDGSETYWEFWYRLYRNEKMYLWVSPNGVLIGNRLYYNEPPRYYFGTPSLTDPAKVKEMHLPCEGVQIRKSTQGRVGEVWVYVHNGKDSWIEKNGTSDPTIAQWVKRPRKLIQDTTSHTRQSARKLAWKEIYEGKVGSFEITLLISNTNYVIQPNRMCRVRIPEIGLVGVYFVVGTRIQAGPNGYVQEIRLREKEIALSRRTPAEPKIQAKIKPAPVLATPDHQYPWDAGANPKDQWIAGIIADGGHSEWADYFWKAANHFRGVWGFDYFLAYLLGIADVESGITNVRERGMNIGVDGVEWYAPTGYNSTGQAVGDIVHPGDPGAPQGPIGHTPAPPGVQGPITVDKLLNFHRNFANEEGSFGLHVNNSLGQAGVGPMQLTSIGLKHQADDYFDSFAQARGQNKAGHNEFFGGRWHPEANIWVAASFLKECLDATKMAPTDGDQTGAFDNAVYKYNHGPASPYQPGDYYVSKVHKAVHTDPGFLTVVNEAIAVVKSNNPNMDNHTEGSTSGEILPYGWPTEEQCIAAFQGKWAGPAQGAGGAGLPEITFLQAAQYRPNRLADIRYIVIHDMELPQTLETASNCANMFATTTRTASAHFALDAQSIFQCVYDKDVAFGSCGTISLYSVNDQALHFEHAGYTTTDWSNPFSQQMLQMSAQLTAKKAKQYGISMVKLTPAQISAGLLTGFCGHDDLTTALNLTGDCAHTDPGSNFPWTQYMQWVNAAT